MIRVALVAFARGAVVGVGLYLGYLAAAVLGERRGWWV